MATAGMIMEDETELAQKGHIKEEFTEFETVKNLYRSLPNIYSDQISVELALEQFTVIVDEYQEQPHLLDPYLEEMVLDFLSIGRDMNVDRKLSHLAFKFLYLLTKARGPKVIVRLLPHEVVDLEPTLALLSAQDPNDYETWESRYMLLLWMSMICMIPFDMSRLDSGVAGAGDQQTKNLPTMDRILNVAKVYLGMSDKCRDAAAFMVSRFLTRHDVKQMRLPEFLDWCLQTLTSEGKKGTIPSILKMAGVLSVLAQLFKLGKRSDILQYAPVVLRVSVECDLCNHNNTPIRKLSMKLVQRLGLTFLPSRVMKWRYQRGSRSLADNLQPASAPAGIASKTTISNDDDYDDENYDIPEEIEDVIEQLLTGLKDKDTIVRWSAAKGIGRLTGRLPQELADQVVGSALDLFSMRETDGAWHGSCLALAELGRRGLLLPARLPEVIPVVRKALAYDVKKGTFSVGAHVRDSACYVCWSFARAYDPEVISPYVNEIAAALLITTVFDREVNCRRAASAAFQENVGRQGTFPHGIDIVTTADYFAVGNRTNTYLNISSYLADFDEYTLPLIDHLYQVKVGHWDGAIRELTSQALHVLTKKAPEYMAKTVLPDLIPKTTGIDLNTRHGSLLAVAELTHALYEYSQSESRSLLDVIGSSSVEGLKAITRKMEEGRMFRGMTGEILRPAVCTLIGKLSLSKLPFHGDDIIDQWQTLLDDNIIRLQRTERDIHSKSVGAERMLCQEYYQDTNGHALPGIQDKVIDLYIKGLEDPNEMGRMGAALVLGELPRFMVKGKLHQILEGLIKASISTKDEDAIHAESRRDAIRSIAKLCATVDIDPSGNPHEVVCESNLSSIYNCLLQSLKDYTTDSRGDVGAWVREAGMKSLYDVTSHLAKNQPTMLTPDIICKIVQCLTQQASEKIDRTRLCAGEAFLGLLHQSDPVIPHIPDRDELIKIFPKEDIKELNWAAPSDCFAKVTQLLKLRTFQYHVLLGLTVSVGGLTESLVKHSAQSLLSFIKTCSSVDDLKRFTDNLLKIFTDYQKVDRVSVPLMKMINLLLSSGCFETFVEDTDHPFPLNLLQLVKKEVTKTGDAQKLLTSIEVFCGMIQFVGEPRKKSLFQLMVFLCHKYPKIRGTTANRLYETLMVYDDVVDEEKQEEVMTILMETNWQESQANCRPIRNHVCDLLGVPQPVLKNPGKAKKQEDADDQMESYKDLVSRLGY
ncbi:tubulin-specific chaperone D-like [Lytechinus variegatus]|uniref:tubulin-specific chaperone D-like n=1 Tax=Lytechinus variegatus TaxID=7654 RepID=UPI001BB13C47|nr:tubulin-specific chaperone D-like [Lytechinus variegatus]